MRVTIPPLPQYAFTAWCLVKHNMRRSASFWVIAKERYASLELTNSLTHSLIYLLTPWCRIFEKLIVTQHVKKCPAFLWNPKVHYRVHTSPPLDPVPIQLNPVCPIDPCLPKVHLNVILPPTPRSSQWSLAFAPPNQNPINTSPLPCACHMSRPPHPPWFNHRNNIRWIIQAVKYIIPFSISLGRAKESFQLQGALKHSVTIKIITVRGC
jgi:hypothetical protein